MTLEDGREAFSLRLGGGARGRGLDAAGILRAAAEGRIEVLVLLGADPVCDFPDRALAERALEQVGTVIAVDQFLTASSSRADVVLAAAGWAEVDGTTTNIEGRVLRLNQKVTPPGTARADWMIAAELAARLGGDLGLDSTSTPSPRSWPRCRRRTATSSSMAAPSVAGASRRQGRDRGGGQLDPLRGGAAARAPGRCRRRRCASPWPTSSTTGAR